MADYVEIVIVINAGYIENNKMRGDIGITYDAECASPYRRVSPSNGLLL